MDKYEKYISDEVICRWIKTDVHCDGCHNELADGYDVFLETRLSKNRVAHTCCDVDDALDEFLKKHPKFKRLEE